jgi:anti-anti-sigma factor
MPPSGRAGPRPRRWPSRIALAVAGVAVLCAGALAWGFRTGFPQEGFAFLYMPLVGAAAYFRGRWAGVLAGIVSLLVTVYFVFPPVHSFAIRPDALPILLSFIVVGALIVEGGARLRHAEAQSSLLAALVQSSDDAIFSTSLDGAILTWNRGAERLYGYTAAEVIGRPVSMLAPPERLDELSDIMSRLRRGERFEQLETERVKKDGTRIDVSFSIAPVTDSAGWIVGASTIARDISERKRVDRHQRFLVNANAVLASSLDVQDTLDALARLTVPALADWCTIRLVADDGSLGPAAVMHPDSAKAELARRAVQRDATRPHPHGPSAARPAQSVVYPDVSAERLAVVEPDPTLREIIGGRGVRSALTVPLMARGRTLGALAFFSAESARRYDQHDLAFAEQLAHQAALAIDNARLHQAEHAERQRTERVASRIGRLQALTASLSEALTPDQVGAVTLRHLIDDLGAAAAAVLLRADDGRSLELLSATGYSADTLGRWRSLPGDVQPVTAAERTGRVVWFASWADFQARYPEAVIPSEPARLGARAAVPLMFHGRPVGALYLNFAEARTLTGEELEFMLTVGRQCAQAVDRARLYARERQIATTLQHALLPAELPHVPGVDIRASYVPAAEATDIGGDWYDVVHLPDGRVVLSVGDVVGHGLEAAATMGEVRHAIRTAVLEGHDPGRVLVVASKVLQLRGEKGMATAVVGLLDPIRQEFAFASAGHPAPVIATSEHVQALESGGPPLGILDAPAPSVVRVPLVPGALLVLYTDGLIEYARDYVRGEAALLEAVRHEQAAHSPNPAQAILERVVPGSRVRDDIAILTVRLEGEPTGVLDLTLPAEVASLARTRHVLQRWARDLGLDEVRTFAMQVAVGEATTNVIQHAYGAAPGTVRLRAHKEGDLLRVEVEDRGRWRPERPGAEGVHGLAMMRSLADSVDVQTTEQGTVVRFAFSTAGPPAGGDGIAAPAVSLDATSPDVAPSGPPDRLQAAEAGRAEPIAGSVEFQRRSVAGLPVLGFTGALDLSTVERFVQALEHAAAGAQRGVILSLDTVTYMDSHGLRALLEARSFLAMRGRVLVLVVPQGAPVHRILDAAGVRPLFPIFPTVEDAVAESAT